MWLNLTNNLFNVQFSISGSASTIYAYLSEFEKNWLVIVILEH